MTKQLILIAPTQRYGRMFFGALWTHADVGAIALSAFEVTKLEGYRNVTVIVAPDAALPPKCWQALERLTNHKVIVL